ncbi:YfiR family protein [Sorangium sp. So ce131]|uniref:YfiR family protein n=1 Tax=Sorangium sp. So ce131 TaxID=3133282 RepID=UPI003F62FC07
MGQAGQRSKVPPGAAIRLAAVLSILTASSDDGLAAPAVPYDLRGAILLRSLGYESGFAGRTGAAVLAVVGEASGESAEDANAMAAVLSKLAAKTTVAKRQATVVRVTYSDKAKLQEALRTSGAEVVYVARGLPSIIPEIPAREGNVVRIVVCGDGDDAKRGCAIAVGLARERPEILLNVKHANAVGLRFDPQLLRLARIVD